jgi:hypothetical protein
MSSTAAPSPAASLPALAYPFSGEGTEDGPGRWDCWGAGGDRGCISGVKITMLGKAPIRHFYKPADGDNFFWVGKGTELWHTLEFTFQGKGTKHHPAKVH